MKCILEQIWHEIYQQADPSIRLDAAYRQHRSEFIGAVLTRIYLDDSPDHRSRLIFENASSIMWGSGRNVLLK